MVLTFPTIEDIKSMIEGPEVNWLGNFFEEFREWALILLLMHFVMFGLIVMACPCICGILTPSLALEGYGVIRSLWMMLLQKIYRSFTSSKVQISTKILELLM